jgi:hypothetical protein
MDHFATDALAFLKANPTWAVVAESLRFGSWNHIYAEGINPLFPLLEGL